MIETGTRIKFDESTQPLLIVVVDTEEEFNWAKPPDSAETSVSHMESLHLTHDICTQYGVSPCYVIDYPIASQKLSADILNGYLAKHQCEIGAHLHPWVNPPIEEQLSSRNMYPGNLPKDLEYRKLKTLRDMIEQQFGNKPNTYKAGRYGFGKNTLDILKQLGFSIDLSFCPPIDHSADGGPDYSDNNSEPFIFKDSDILEIPISGSFTGIMGKYSKPVFNISQRFEKIRMPGILSRTNVLDRLILSPEGYTPEEHIKVVKYLYKKGQRVFTWSFHSPTVVPGNTAYVTNKVQQQNYLDCFKRFFDYFFNQLNGSATTPTEIYKMMEK